MTPTELRDEIKRGIEHWDECYTGTPVSDLSRTFAAHRELLSMLAWAVIRVTHILDTSSEVCPKCGATGAARTEGGK